MLNHSLKYRPDVDGLRAVAVLSVVLYHFNFTFLSGGFIGVDIFFVISGYLITSILIKGFENGTYSLGDFYVRRIRRILPVLSIVMLIVLVAGWNLFLPDDFKFLGQSVFATTLFSSNFLYWKKVDYFDTSAETNPLLHTWSLAVEEQFYIFFPIILYFIWKSTNWRNTIVIAGFILSFILSVMSVRFYESATFYMLPTRAWELLAGSIVAMNILPLIHNKALSFLTSFLGFVMIILSILYTDIYPYFPAEAALPCVLGSCMIIHAGKSALDNPVNMFLGLKPIVFIGLISYSMYLWHWPLLVFTEYYLVRDLLYTEMLLLLSVLFFISYISWKYIELPFRDKNSALYSDNKLLVFRNAAICMGLFLAVSSYIHIDKGVPERLQAETLVLEKAKDDFSPYRKKCHSLESYTIPPEEACIYGTKKPQEDILVWGDSHAVEFAYALGELAEKNNKSLKHLSSSSCPPARGYNPKSRKSCSKVTEEYLDYAMNKSPAKNVVLVAYYHPYKNEPEFFKGMEQTVQMLTEHGKQVSILLPIPSARGNVPRQAALYSIYHKDYRDLDINLTDYKSEYQHIFDFFQKMKQKYNVTLLDPLTGLCNETTCPVMDDGQHTYFFDAHHLSMTGAKLVAKPFENIILSRHQ